MFPLDCSFFLIFLWKFPILIPTSPKHAQYNCPTAVNTCADSLKFLFRSDQNPDVKSAVCPCRLIHTSFFQTCQVTRPLAINSLVHKFQQKNGQMEIKDRKCCLYDLLHLHVTAGNFAKFTDFAVTSAKNTFRVQPLMHQMRAASCSERWGRRICF